VTVIDLVRAYNPLPADEPAATAAPAEAADTLGEPPADIIAPAGLPPMRGALARHLAWRSAISDELDLLEGGRVDLYEHLGKLENARREANERLADAATSLLQRLWLGQSVSIDATPSDPAPSEEEAKIALEALHQLDAEIAEKRALLDLLDAKIERLARSALREEGRAIEADYERLVEDMRQKLAEIIALRRVTGGGFGDRLCLELPSFTGRHDRQPLRIDEAHVNAAKAVWLEQLAAWRDDPSSPAVLCFPKHDPAKTEAIIYHELSGLERRLVDEQATLAS
jgi:hypothetical protein